MKHMKEKEYSVKDKILGGILASPIFALLLMWNNHVIIQWPIHFWQFWVLSLPLMYISNSFKFTKPIIGCIFIVTLLGQVCYWIGLVTLPLIKLQVAN